MTIDKSKDDGSWPLWTMIIPVALLLFAGLLGACDPPPADAAVPHEDLTALATLPPEVQQFLAAMYEQTNPCPTADDATEESVIACIRFVWPDELEEKAIAVVFGQSPDGTVARMWRRNTRCAESHGNPFAVGPNGEVSLFQLHPQHFKGRGFAKKLGYTKADAVDPQTNAELALYLYEHAKSGWFQWTCANRSWPRHG